MIELKDTGHYIWYGVIGVIIFLTILWAANDLATRISDLNYKIDSFKLPVHNGVVTISFGDRSNLFTVLPDGRLYLLIALPVTDESSIIEILEEKGEK